MKTLRIRRCALLVLLMACAGGCTVRTPGQPVAPFQPGEPAGKRAPQVLPDLGISVAAADRGILIAGVRPEGPAELADLRVGDILVEMDGRPLAGMFPPDFLRNVDAVPAGGVVTLRVLRSGATFTRKAVNGVGLPDLAKLTALANREFDGVAAPPAATDVPTPPLPNPAIAAPVPPVVQPAMAPAATTSQPPATEAARPLVLTIRKMLVTPASVAPGARFTIEVTYIAPSIGPVSFSFVIFADGRELLASKPEEIDGGGTPSVYSRTIGAAAEPGTYRIRVRLAQGNEAVERSAPLTVTAPVSSRETP